MSGARPLPLVLILLSPFGVALFPVVHLAGINIGLITDAQIAGAIAATVAATAVVFALAWRASRALDFAAVATSLIAIFFFGYGRIYEPLMKSTQGWPVLGDRDVLHLVLMIVGLAVVSISIRVCWRNPAIVGPVQLCLSVAAFVALLPSSFVLVRDFEHHADDTSKSLPEWIAGGDPFEPAEPLEHASAERPDIYYIILDGYTRHDVLAERFGYDNSGFLEQLEERGFYIAERSHSNYALTFLSLASSLNYRYMNDIANGMLARGDLSRQPFHSMIQRPRAAELLKSKGYRYVTISTHWAGTERSAIADQSFEFSPIFSGEFANMLIRTTLLRPLAPGVAELHLFTFDKLAEIPAIVGPTFAFVHFILPHSPFVFDREGNIKRNHSLVQFAAPVTKATPEAIASERGRLIEQIEEANERTTSRSAQSRWSEDPMQVAGARPPKVASGYVDQVIYTNRRILEAIDVILAEGEADPIIILQGDHGTATSGRGAKGPHPRERLAILNALRVPKKMRKKLRADMTPVNTFRLIFNHLFDADLERLQDRSFYSWYDNTYLVEAVPPRELRQRPSGARRP
jgi:hypothetical protein